jgi:hypothetical protein
MYRSLTEPLTCMLAPGPLTRRGRRVTLFDPSREGILTGIEKCQASPCASPSARGRPRLEERAQEPHCANATRRSGSPKVRGKRTVPRDTFRSLEGSTSRGDRKVSCEAVRLPKCKDEASTWRRVLRSTTEALLPRAPARRKAGGSAQCPVTLFDPSREALLVGIEKCHASPCASPSARRRPRLEERAQEPHCANATTRSGSPKGKGEAHGAP